MSKYVEEFARRCNAVNTNDTELHMEIEVAYEQCIVRQKIPKGEFLEELYEKHPNLARVVVNHLFTPINWSRVKLRTLWGIKNTATGNLLTLERNPDTDVFILKESSEVSDNLDFAPMLTGSQEDAQLFIRMLNEVPTDAPLGVNETLVSLEVQDRINIANLEAVEVKVIF